MSCGGEDKAVEALLRGQDCANRLMSRFHNPMKFDGSIPNDALANTVLDSFTNALSLLSTNTSTTGPKFDHMPKGTSKRRCRKREAGSEYFRDDCPTPIYHDGFFWRKYGQKDIKTSPHQRAVPEHKPSKQRLRATKSYYRCAYMKEQECDAKKHVQKIQENPPVYRTTYMGQHSCRIRDHSLDFPIGSDPIDDNVNADGSRIIRFDQEISNKPISPTTVSVNHQEMTRDEAVEATEQMNNQECEMFYMDYGQSFMMMPYDYPDPLLSPSTFFDTEAMLDISSHYM